jgi:hypothetical protein
VTAPLCGRPRRLQVNGLDLRLHEWVRGERSTVMTCEAAERVARTARRGTVAELPGAFHHLIVDDPAGFAARVSSRLAALGARERPPCGPRG